MRIASILLTGGLLAALPLASQAQERCEHAAARDARLDLSGVKTVVFDIGPHTLTLTGDTQPGGSIRGKACASDPKRLAGLVISQHREGDKLMVRAEQVGGLRNISWSDKQYAHLTLAATIPETLAVQLKVGSGDAVVDGVASLSADVGSGEVDARHVRDTFFADVGSGDIHATDIGALHVVSVGSGDLDAHDLRGDVTVGDVLSGDLVVENAAGKVEIGSIGSGDAALSGIGGSVTVASIGSGDLNANDITGDLVVSSVGSGSVGHRNVRGQVRVPKDD